jgi:hypothetical protein
MAKPERMEVPYYISILYLARFVAEALGAFIEGDIRDRWACSSCGNVLSHKPEPDDPCRRCGHHGWMDACLLIKEGTLAYEAASA